MQLIMMSCYKRLELLIAPMKAVARVKNTTNLLLEGLNRKPRRLACLFLHFILYDSTFKYLIQKSITAYNG